MSATPSSALVIGGSCHRTRTKFATPSRRGVFDRSDQINQNSRGSTALSGVRIKQAEKPSLYDVERSGSVCIRRCRAAKLALCVRRCSTVGIGGADRDRTDDLKLAKLPLSQLSYGPNEGASSE